MRQHCVKRGVTKASAVFIDPQKADWPEISPLSKPPTVALAHNEQTAANKGAVVSTRDSIACHHHL